VFYYYNSAPDSDATIVGAGYFSDGVTKGMRKGDLSMRQRRTRSVQAVPGSVHVRRRRDRAGRWTAIT
jgi:hypothetical protein